MEQPSQRYGKRNSIVFVIVSKEERHCFDPMRERLVFASCFLFLSYKYNLFVTKFKLFLRYFLYVC